VYTPRTADIRTKESDEYRIAVVMPALNEENAVGTVVKGIREAFSAVSYPIKLEVVVVDGNSHDGTVAVARNEGAHVIIQKNKGYGDALYSGFLFSKRELNCDIICTLDADGSYDPTSLVSSVTALIGDEFDLVVCTRVPEKGAMKFSSRFGNALISSLVRRILGVKVSDTQSGMFIFWSYLADNIHPKLKGWAFNTEILTRALESEYRLGEIPVKYSIREGETKLSVISGGAANMGAILRMVRDSRPLFFHGAISALLLLAALLFGILAIVRGSQMLAILTTLAAVAGIQVFALGMLADMIKDLRTSELRKPVPYRRA
jgi:dolichol-phosphate mannosyltransferase